MSSHADQFRALYDGHHDRIRRLMARTVGRDDADDLTQTVFLKAFDALPAFRAECRASSWLHRIAVNVACDWWRQQRHEVANGTGTAPAPDTLVQEPGVPSPEQALTREQAAAFIRATISGLPPRYRDVLMLRDIGGLSDDETAAVLGVTPGNARVILHRARQALKEVVGPRCDEFRAALSCRPSSPDCCRPGDDGPSVGRKPP